MTRVDPSRLADPEHVLGEVRSWAGVEDRGGGTFYLHRRPFLHFHAGRGSRRADVRAADGWVEIDLPEPLPEGARDRLLTAVRAERAAR